MAATYTRSSAWDNGGTLAGNSTLLWYAIGVGRMMERTVTEPKSWWYFAAMHGEARMWPQLPSPPQIPAPSPVQATWNQCQHATWYFPPWHRGYLMAIENQLRQDIVAAGGPADWALPYWNYFGEQKPPKQFDMPPAFAETHFPAANSLPANVPANVAGSPNPLFVAGRYGPNGDGVIFVPTRAGIRAHPNDPNSDFSFGPVTDECMGSTVYTGDTPDGFGGGETGFEHFGSATGGLENNPHNLVHSYVGGVSSETQQGGLMGDPRLAGLDPIFFLHHAQIDRLWAVWDVTLKNSNPTAANWLYGPSSGGESDFVMPWNGSFWRFTCNAVTDMAELDYAYADMSAPAGMVPAAETFSARIAALRDAPAATRITGSAGVQPGKKIELLGATQAPVEVKGASARAAVQIDAGVRDKVSRSLLAAAPTAPPDRVLLRLDNVVGTVGGVLSVFIDLPEGAKPAQHEELRAGSVGLFGMQLASEPDGKHGGKGLTFTLDITKAVDQLHLSRSFDLDKLHVSLVSSLPIPDDTPITVGRISVYRQAQ